MNLDGEIYEVEIAYPTNSGESSVRKFFASKDEAKEFAMSCAGEDYEYLDLCEWDPCGPNWSIIEHIRTEDGRIITIAQIDNTYKEEK